MDDYIAWWDRSQPLISQEQLSLGNSEYLGVHIVSMWGAKWGKFGQIGGERKSVGRLIWGGLSASGLTPGIWLNRLGRPMLYHWATPVGVGTLNRVYLISPQPLFLGSPSKVKLDCWQALRFVLGRTFSAVHLGQIGSLGKRVLWPICDHERYRLVGIRSILTIWLVLVLLLSMLLSRFTILDFESSVSAKYRTAVLVY